MLLSQLLAACDSRNVFVNPKEYGRRAGLDGGADKSSNERLSSGQDDLDGISWISAGGLSSVEFVQTTSPLSTVGGRDSVSARRGEVDPASESPIGLLHCSPTPRGLVVERRAGDTEGLCGVVRSLVRRLP